MGNIKFQVIQELNEGWDGRLQVEDWLEKLGGHLQS